MFDKKELINYILSDDTYYSAFVAYNNYSRELEGTRFIFFDEVKGTPLPKYHQLNSQELSILSINADQKFLILDKLRVKEMINYGTTNFHFDNAIHFDTQVVSYLSLLLKNKNISEPKMSQVYKLLYFVLSRNIDYTCYPYLFENWNKLSSIKTLEGVHQSLCAFLFFKSLNLNQFKEYILSKAQVSYSSNTLIQADEFIANMKNNYFNDYLWEGIYCLLLKVIIIDWSSNRKVKKKLEELLDFINFELGVFLEREFVIAYLFLKKDKSSKSFFKRIQPTANELIKTIQGMSWDLWHIRRLAEDMNINTTENIPFEMHSLATFDKGLKDVLLAYPVRAIFFDNDGSAHWCYKNKLEEFIPEIDLTDSHEGDRKKAFALTNRNMLITKLEKEILELAST
ncbi:hypothetical protein [Oceanobacillus jeddahense]|uniref:hypothetical protein n=1 Tax=Oceanobacillus jeddahense TaxID=1462527 RepID=UPI000595A0F8|nr:hypothetical protein [Oceanobacillus jeddahense]